MATTTPQPRRKVALPPSGAPAPIYLKLEETEGGVRLLLVDERGERVDSGYVGAFHTNEEGKLYFTRAFYPNAALVAYEDDDSQRIQVR